MERLLVPAPVLIRAALTSDEWTRLRQLALAEARPVKDLVADALRAAYPLTPKEQSE
jgi:hypothetical protein